MMMAANLGITPGTLDKNWGKKWKVTPVNCRASWTNASRQSTKPHKSIYQDVFWQRTCHGGNPDSRSKWYSWTCELKTLHHCTSQDLKILILHSSGKKGHWFVLWRKISFCIPILQWSILFDVLVATGDLVRASAISMVFVCWRAPTSTCHCSKVPMPSHSSDFIGTQRKTWSVLQ